MKYSFGTLLLFLFPLFIFQSCSTDQAAELETFDLKGQSGKGNVILIPDDNFQNTLVNVKCVDIDGDGTPDVSVDSNQNGQIEKNETNSVESLIMDFEYGTPVTFVDLTGIENFSNLKRLKITGTGGSYLIDEGLNIENLNYDFTGLRKLESLEIHHLGTEYFETIDLSGLSKLTDLDLSQNRPIDFYSERNQFVTIKMDGCGSLKNLTITNSFLNIDFCEIPSLEKLNMSYLEGGEPENFDFHCLTNLKWLDISENVIQTLILKNSSVLETFIFNGGYEEMEWWYPSPNLICIDDLQEEYDQVSPLFGENTTVITDCNF